VTAGSSHPPDFRQILPDLAVYRSEFVAAGVAFPLPRVPTRPDGLLGALPVAPAGRHGWPWDTQTPPSLTAGPGWPLISIVMPSYNQAEYFEEALRSVLLQNYPNLEFIVLDGGSSDASPAMIERYRPWLSFARVARDRGQAHALNLGFSLANGQLRGWLNSDDLYLPGAFHRLADMWQRTRADFIYGDAITLDQQTGVRTPTAAGLVHGRYAKFPGAIFSHAAFWTATAHVPVWEEQVCALDYELWIRLVPGRRARHISWPLGVFRHHAAAKSFSPAMQRRWDEDARRNGLAHPALYRPNRWLDWEHRIVERLVHRSRSRQLSRAFATVCAECRWSETGS
jgi:hypothetical protein